MNLLQTVRTPQHLSSTDDVLNLTAPASWKDMTQKQLRYVLTLMTLIESRDVVKTYMFARFLGIHVINKDIYGWKCFVRTTWWGKRRFFTLQTWQVESLLSQFDYIDSFEDFNTRLDGIDGLRAVDVDLHGVRFIDYLNCEKLYQTYMAEQNPKYIDAMALILYRKPHVASKKLAKNPLADRAGKIDMTDAERLGTFMWFAHVKVIFARAFPHFFRQAASSDNEEFNIIDSINIQIRALTDGDVTKEEAIYNIPCWRALTELDSKAREADELKKIYNSNGNK